MKVLVVGKLFDGSNVLSLAEGFVQLGHEVRTIDTVRWTQPGRFTRHWWELRRRNYLGREPQDEFKSELASASRGWTPDILLAFKTISLDQTALLESPAKYHVHYSADDVSNSENLSKEYLKYESDWDLVITTKSYNVAEIESRSKVPAAYVWSAYDPRIHLGSPIKRVSTQYDVGFIGAYRSDRYFLPRATSAVAPGKSVIYGPGWRKRYLLGASAPQFAGPVPGSRFLEAARSMFVTPVMLNSSNRDLHTCRTFEAAAAGNVLVVERTDEHQLLFEEDVECLFYEGRNEESLKDALARAVANTRTSERLAEASYRRVVSGRNSYADRASEIVAELAL